MTVIKASSMLYIVKLETKARSRIVTGPEMQARGQSILGLKYKPGLKNVCFFVFNLLHF